MRNTIVIIIVAIFALGYFVSKHQEKQPKKAFEVYMNEPLAVTGLDITVTDVKEAKQIKNIKAKNTFLQLFVTVKNTKNANVYIPHTLAIVNRQDSKWICDIDNRFKNGLEKTEYVAGGYLLNAKEQLNAQMIFSCDNYLNEKAGARKSKPADFSLFVYSKEKKDGGYIFLEKRP